RCRDQVILSTAKDLFAASGSLRFAQDDNESMSTSVPRIKTTVVGSYPVPDWLAAAPSEQGLIDATRVVIATQEDAGVDVVCDGELYRFDLNHPETNGMIEYFVRPMHGIRHELTFDEVIVYRAMP